LALLIDPKGSAVDILVVTGFYELPHNQFKHHFYFVRDTKITKYQSSLENKPGKFSTESLNRWWNIKEEESVTGDQTDHRYY
jgi:hypothetical protein